MVEYKIGKDWKKNKLTFSMPEPTGSKQKGLYIYVFLNILRKIMY